MSLDINRVLKIYLGTDENGGYEPLYREERMREAYAEHYSEMMRRISSYLAMDHGGLEPIG